MVEAFKHTSALFRSLRTGILSLISVLTLGACHITSDNELFSQSDVIPGLPKEFALNLIQKASDDYVWRAMANDFEGRVFVRMSGGTYRMMTDKGAAAVRIKRIFEGDNRWLVAQVRETKDNTHQFRNVLFYLNGGKIALLPIDTALLDAWQPTKASHKRIRTRLMASSMKAQTMADIADWAHAASRFPVSHRSVYKIVAPGEAVQTKASNKTDWKLWSKSDEITGRTNHFARLDATSTDPSADIFLFFQCVDGTLSFWITNEGLYFRDEFPSGEGKLALVEYRQDDAKSGKFVMAIGRAGDELLNVPPGWALSYEIVKNFRPSFANVPAVVDPAYQLDWLASMRKFVIRIYDAGSKSYTARFTPFAGVALRNHFKTCL